MAIMYGEPLEWIKKMSKGYPYVVFTQLLVGVVIAIQVAQFSKLLAAIVFFAIFIPHLLLVIGIQRVGEALNKTVPGSIQEE